MDNMTFLNDYTRNVNKPLENALVPREDESKNIIRMEQNVVYSKDELSELGIIHQGMDEQVVANSFRNLRTSLLKQMDRVNSCVLISSLGKEGGAGFTSVNLAAAFSFDQKKTALLIDCNFAKSKLENILGVEAEVGLRDYIADRVDDIKDIVYPTVVPRLRLVPCGSDDTDYGEFFTGKRMRTFMEEVMNKYSDRVIIINAPPLLESADTQILAELCDYAVMVLPYGGVSPDAVNKALKAIDNRKVAGFIINN